eukprot:4694751-Amphidinium_carterae.1
MTLEIGDVSIGEPKQGDQVYALTAAAQNTHLLMEREPRRGGKRKPRSKSPGQSPRRDGRGTNREQVSNSAWALSAGVDDHDLAFGDALLDSGASHVILPLSELTPPERYMLMG